MIYMMNYEEGLPKNFKNKSIKCSYLLKTILSERKCQSSSLRNVYETGYQKYDEFRISTFVLK